MPLGLPVALVLAAQAAAAPSASPPVAPSEAPAPAPDKPASADSCRPGRPDPNTREIVICAERVQGYRINPDILTAKRLKRSGGRPSRPGAAGVKDRSRCVVGPEGCPSAGINMIGAALTAAEMASRLSKGQEIGSMFVTDPQPSEYQLYVEAKAAREAKEAEKKAAAAAKAKAAPATSGVAAPAPQAPQP